MSLPRPPAGKGLGVSTSSHRRGSAPALARCRQVRRATHLEGRSRKRRTCASRVQGRLVNRVIVGKSTTVARSPHQSVYRWFGCQSSQAGSSVERARVQASSPDFSGGGSGGVWTRWQRQRRQRRPLVRVEESSEVGMSIVGKRRHSDSSENPGEGGANCEKKHLHDR